MSFASASTSSSSSSIGAKEEEILFEQANNNGTQQQQYEEDLELTRQAIMNHIEQISIDSDNNGVLDEDEENRDDEDCENSSTDDNSQPQKLDVQQSKELTINNSKNDEITKQQQSTSSSSLTAPTIPKILRYTIPAIGIWLCSPVLSMIDTAAVGLLSGTAQQAALNPAVSVTDYGALVVAFMYTATTNLIAAAVQEDKDDYARATTLTMNTQQKTTDTLITALKLALFVGSIFGILLMTTGKQLLTLLIGNNSSLDPTVFHAALQYVRIRSLGIPAMVVIGTAQSACLGMQDVTSPLYVLLAAAVINFLGDVLLVPRSGVFGGAAGAAWATVASQYAALLFFGRWLTASTDGIGKDGEKRRNLFFWKSKKKEDDDTNNNSIRPVERKQQSTKSQPKIRGFLSNSKLTLNNYLSFSDLNKSKAREFLPFVVPVTTTSLGRISGYIAMSHVASSTLGTYDMAGHQIIFSIFCCLTPFVDALSQVAQSFVPAVFEAKEKSQERATTLRKTISNFRKVGVGFGAVLVGLVACIPLISRYFTTDPMVLERVNSA